MVTCYLAAHLSKSHISVSRRRTRTCQFSCGKRWEHRRGPLRGLVSGVCCHRVYIAGADTDLSPRRREGGREAGQLGRGNGRSRSREEDRRNAAIDGLCNHLPSLAFSDAIASPRTDSGVPSHSQLTMDMQIFDLNNAEPLGDVSIPMPFAEGTIQPDQSMSQREGLNSELASEALLLVYVCTDLTPHWTSRQSDLLAVVFGWVSIWTR